MTVLLQQEDFSPDQVQRDHLAASDKIGATVCFTGLVRQDDDCGLLAMEHF